APRWRFVRENYLEGEVVGLGDLDSPSPPNKKREAGIKSLSENYEGCCGDEFWMWTRRPVRSIPGAGCEGRANEVRIQKTRRPEGFPANGCLASLLLSRRPT